MIYFMFEQFELKPTFWFIENPRGGMRKMNFMRELEPLRHTMLTQNSNSTQR